MVAWLIDFALVFGIILGGFLVGALIGGAINDTLGGLIVAVAYIGAFAFMFWQLAVQGSKGQTIGKRQMRIKLLREQDGQVVGAGLSIGRYFVHFLDAIPCYVGYLWPLWDAKKQTFADKILQTVVVKV